MIDDMVYKVPPYNDELDTCEADDSYDYGERVFKKAEAQMQEAYASIKRIKGVSYRSSRLSNCIDSNKKSHLICPFIVDWWNMRNYNFKSFELCYYARYGDDPAQYINSIPPPMPNPSIYPQNGGIHSS